VSIDSAHSERACCAKTLSISR